MDKILPVEEYHHMSVSAPLEYSHNVDISLQSTMRQQVQESHNQNKQLSLFG